MDTTITATPRLTTAGAGVDPRRIHKPSKRLRNWHRGNSAGLSLKAFARQTVATASSESKAQTVVRWFASKAARL